MVELPTEAFQIIPMVSESPYRDGEQTMLSSARRPVLSNLSRITPEFASATSMTNTTH